MDGTAAALSAGFDSTPLGGRDGRPRCAVSVGFVTGSGTTAGVSTGAATRTRGFASICPALAVQMLTPSNAMTRTPADASITDTGRRTGSGGRRVDGLLTGLITGLTGCTIQSGAVL